MRLLYLLVLIPAITLALSLPTDMEFISIPAGEFWMGGDPSSHYTSADQLPRIQVHIESFEIMSTEVTQGMWETVMGTTIQDLRDAAGPDWYLRGVGADFPVYYVSIVNCWEFIDRLNDLDSSFVYRLPSESEWEYACRAGSETEFYWGNESSREAADPYCWYNRNAFVVEWSEPHAPASGIQPVGTRLPNAWGLYHMAGNVCEWCSDWFQPDLWNMPRDGSPFIGHDLQDLEEVVEWKAVHRGGAFSYEISDCRSATRGSQEYNSMLSNVGFRLVRERRTVETESEAVFRQGLNRIVLGEYAEALVLVEQALEMVPDNTEFQCYRGAVSYLLGDIGQAEIDFTEILEQTPDNVQTLVFNISLFLAQDEWKRGIEEIDRLLEIEPEHHEAHFVRGLANVNLGRLEEVIEDMSAEIALDPGNLTALLIRANSYAELGMFSRALEDVDRILAADPTHPQALYLREQVLPGAGREALESLQ